MASISDDPNGHRRILFVDREGKRKTIRLGKVPKRLAEEIKAKVEAIAAAAASGFSLDGETAAWLGKIDNKLHARLAVAGLVEPRETPESRQKVRLGEWLDTYIAGRTDVKPNTRRNLEAARARLVEFFGCDKTLEDITAGDVDEWVVWLRGRYASGTSGRTIKRAKQFCQAAVRKKLIPSNPFAEVKPPSQVNTARNYLITREDAVRVLDACPDAEWRLLFALSRFGGLRCPSEHLALKWTDVDWVRGRFRVASSKTEHLEGGGVRWVPIFPELRLYLEEAFELAPEGAVYVIGRYRDTNSNLRTQLQRIIRRAGLEPWPKLFHNLRATRETELTETFPLHVVCAWIGNTPKVAEKHYLQVTADTTRRRHAKWAAQKAAQKAAQHPAAPSRTICPETAKTPEIQGFLPPGAIPCEAVQCTGIPPAGLEPA
jgi:integrase